MPIWEQVVEILKYPIFIVLIIVIGLFLLIRTILRAGKVEEPPALEEAEETPAITTDEGKTPLALESAQRKQQAIAEEEAREMVKRDLNEIAEERPEIIENLIKYWLEHDKGA